MNSGWERKEAKEMVAIGYIAWKRRLQRREEEGSGLYRSAASSLQGRTRKKLTGKEDWYKTRKANKRKSMMSQHRAEKGRKEKNRTGRRRRE